MVVRVSTEGSHLGRLATGQPTAIARSWTRRLTRRCLGVTNAHEPGRCSTGGPVVAGCERQGHAATLRRLRTSNGSLEAVSRSG